jgi:hypothetical protein
MTTKCGAPWWRMSPRLPGCHDCLEVAWLTPQDRYPYWRGTITALAYEFAPR